MIEPARSAGFTALLLCVVLASAAAWSPALAAEAAHELAWDDLMPADWNPFGEFADRFDALGDGLADGTPEADALMSEYRELASSAPVVGALDGQRVRLPGFVVPLEFSGTEVSEFLLVPYVGACIHVPPPPKNQIVFVETERSHAIKELFEPVWITGVLRTEAVLNDVGDAGYTMHGAKVEPYE